MSSCRVDSYQSVSSRSRASCSGARRRERLLDRASHGVYASRRVPGRAQERRHVLLAQLVRGEVVRVHLHALRLRGPVGLHGRGLEGRRVDLRRSRHPFEGVVEVHVAPVGADVLEREQHREDRSAAPDATLHERTGNTAIVQVADGVHERLQASGARQRVRKTLLDDAPVHGGRRRLVKVDRRRRFFGRRRPAQQPLERGAHRRRGDPGHCRHHTTGRGAKGHPAPS